MHVNFAEVNQTHWLLFFFFFCENWLYHAWMLWTNLIFIFFHVIHLLVVHLTWCHLLVLYLWNWTPPWDLLNFMKIVSASVVSKIYSKYAFLLAWSDLFGRIIQNCIVCCEGANCFSEYHYSIWSDSTWTWKGNVPFIYFFHCKILILLLPWKFKQQIWKREIPPSLPLPSTLPGLGASALAGCFSFLFSFSNF